MLRTYLTTLTALSLSALSLNSFANTTHEAVHAAPVDSEQSWTWQTIAEGLEHPWGMAQLPDGDWLVTERPGRLRIVHADGSLGEPIKGLPEIAAGGQGGLLDINIDPNFSENREVYFCYSEPGNGGNSTAMAKARLSDDRSHLEQLHVLFSQQPKINSSAHFGCRIVFDNQQHVFLTLGERYSQPNSAQTLDNHLGKIIRLNTDGTIPQDNPFTDNSEALPEIWSYGHRNVQGATFDRQGKFWAMEHGPQGGDEINIIHAGSNYGWPVITYGEQYGGGQIGIGTEKEGMEQPLYYWTPSNAPSNLTFVHDTPYGEDWDGSLLIGALKFMYLGKIDFDDNGIPVRESKITVNERVRDVAQGQDGYVYILTDNPNGRLLKLTQ